MTIRRKIPALSLAAALSAAAGCAPPAEEGETLAVSCEGKCDGLSSVRSILADARKLDVNDLVAMGARAAWEKAAEQLNAKLSAGGITFAQIAAQPAKAYALDSEASGDRSLGNLDALVTDLAARYGDRELTTQINVLRRNELQAHAGSVFAESAFRLEPGLHTGFSFGAGGLDNSNGSVGFFAGKVNEMRLVSRIDSERVAYLVEPLKAMLASRGFIMPTTVADVGQMLPGEVIARSGAGVIAANLATSVPLLVTEPTGGLGFGILFNAQLRTKITADKIDVQIARLDGDEVVVDVGVSDGVSIWGRLATEDGFGALAVPKVSQKVGDAKIELARLAEKALVKALGGKEKLFSAAVAGGHSTSRISVSRLRFNLGALDEAGQEALAQAIQGDLRLAQALAWKKSAGVTADFDLFRSGVSSTSSAGVELLGMRFFTETAHGSGEIIAQTPGGARALLFDTLQKAGGWFFNSHGFNRVGLGGLTYDADGRAKSETNLFVQVEHGNKFLSRDALLDHLDAIISGVGGKAALAAIEDKGNAIERAIQSTCDAGNAYAASSCSKANLATDERAAAMAALEGTIGDLPADGQDLVRKAAQLRLAANAAYEFPAQFVGPTGSVVMGYRIDDAGLGGLLDDGGAARFKEAVYGYLETTNVDRDAADSLASQRAGVRADKRGKVEALGAALDAIAQRYQRLQAAETSVIDGVGQVGPRALEIRFTVDNHGDVDYESAMASSFAEARMSSATQLFDKLRDSASGLGAYAEQVVANGLLGAMPKSSRELRFDVKFDLKSESDGTAGHYVTAGYKDTSGSLVSPTVSVINGGLFSIDALLKTEE